MKELFGAVTSEVASSMLLIASTAKQFSTIYKLYPSFSTILQNIYHAPVHLFVVGEGEISSTEGTTPLPWA